MSWTDERIELLRKRWTEGSSASQIAAELGGVTRNAVIGKVHRLKLESRIKPATAAAAPVVAAPVAEPVLRRVEAPAIAAVEAPRMVVAAQNAVRVSGGAGRSAAATALRMEEEVDLVAETAPVQRQSAEIVPMSRNLTLIQLSERTCKWPLGDPLSPDFRFCGNHSGDGSPYCQYHARIAFQPASDRRKVR